MIMNDDLNLMRISINFTLISSLSMKSDSPLASHPPPDPAVLETWLRERGAKRREGIQPSLATDGSGWGVWANEDIARGEICT
jgi:hypothetical protein